MRPTVATSILTLVVMAAAASTPVEPRAGMAVPITEYSGLVNVDKSVNFHALSSHGASVKAKILRGFDNYEKNTGKNHPFAANGVEKRANDVPLIAGSRRESWYGSILVGTPENLFTVVFDTGSADFFLPSSACETCEGHSLYNPTSSLTSEDMGEICDIEYGDGSTVSIVVCTDTVTIAGYTADIQTLGAAIRYSPEFQISQFTPDGVMGMSFQSISAYDAPPVFQTLVDDREVANPVFSFKLSNPGAELYIGGSNSALYTGSFTYIPVMEEGFWLVTMDNVQGNGETIVSDVPAIIDTGASVIFGPLSDVETLYTSLAARSIGDGRFTFPCDSFPTISLTLDGVSFPIPTSALIIGQRSSEPSECISGIVGLQTLQDAKPFWVIGNVFLRNVYTTFDLGKLQVGFAQLAPEPSSVP